MGYGEYDGGGSVRWKVKHGNGDHAIADPDTRSGARGRDFDPPGNKGDIAVVVKERGKKKKVVFRGALKGTHIEVVWGKHLKRGR